MAQAMSSALLPWVRLGWAVQLCVGPRDWWRAGHIVATLGMTLMYLLPRTSHPALYRVELVLFVLVTAGVVIVAGSCCRICER